MTDDDGNELTVSRVVVERRVHADGTLVDWFEATDDVGDPLPLLETLGMLRLAEDTAIRAAMGEGLNGD